MAPRVPRHGLHQEYVAFKPLVGLMVREAGQEQREKGPSPTPERRSWCRWGVVWAASARPLCRKNAHNQRFQRKKPIAVQPCATRVAVWSSLP
jgi:hypothetical protein